MTLGNARPSAPCALVASPARGDYALGPCILHPSPLGLLSVPFATDAGGSSVLSLPIPTFPGLLGANAWLQWIVLDLAGSYGPGFASFSPGLRARIGGS